MPNLSQNYFIQIPYQKNKAILVVAITYSTSYLIDVLHVVWDGRLWYNGTNLIDDCSHQMSLTECGKYENGYFTLRQGIDMW
jgi:hypothetical protein